MVQISFKVPTSSRYISQNSITIQNWNEKSILCYVHQWQIDKMWRFLLNTKRSSCENTCTLRWHVYERDRQNYCRQCRKPILGKYMAKPQIPIIEKTSQNSAKHWPYYYLTYFICQNLWTIMLPRYPNLSMYPNLDTICSRKPDELFTRCCRMVAFHICKMANIEFTIISFFHFVKLRQEATQFEICVKRVT